MGEIADMMLDGDLCEGCGVYMGSPGQGFTRLCQSCAPERKAARKAVNIAQNTDKQMTSKQVKSFYKSFRRRGYVKGEPALKDVFAIHARLSGAFAIMEASGWKANPLQLAKTANAIGEA